MGGWYFRAEMAGVLQKAGDAYSRAAPDPRHELKNIFPHVSILFIVSEAQLILSKKLTTTQNSFHHFPYWLHKIV